MEQSGANISWSVSSPVSPMVIQSSYYHLHSQHQQGLQNPVQRSQNLNLLCRMPKPRFNQFYQVTDKIQKIYCVEIYNVMLYHFRASNHTFKQKTMLKNILGLFRWSQDSVEWVARHHWMVPLINVHKSRRVFQQNFVQLIL